MTSLAQQLQQRVTVAEETARGGSEQTTQQTVENSQYTNREIIVMAVDSDVVDGILVDT